MLVVCFARDHRTSMHDISKEDKVRNVCYAGVTFKFSVNVLNQWKGFVYTYDVLKENTDAKQ